MEQHQVDVCIVGCGLAGLSAANYLLENSDHHKICLIEARDRAGGRTNTITLSDLQQQYSNPLDEKNQSKKAAPFTVDIGGQWIGTDHQYALSLIYQFGLELEEQIYPHFEDNSTNLLASLVSMVSYHFPNLSEEEEKQVNNFVLIVDEIGKNISLDKPWDGENATELDVSIYDYVVKTTPSQRAQQEIFIFIQTILATSPHDCSFLFFLFYIKSGGGMRALGDGLHGAQRWKVVGGAQQISDCLLNRLIHKYPDRFSCYFSSPVKSIAHEVGVNRITVQSLSKSGDILSITCQRLILAMSPRLSNSTIQFIPPLPLPKQRLADVMVPGACVKVLIPYLTEYWLSGLDGGPINGNKTLGDIYPIHNMFHSTVGTLPALVGLITGDHARSYLQLTPDERKQAVLNQIHQLFCSHLSREESPAFQPVTFIEKSWVLEEYSGGCFACLFRPKVFCEYGPHLRTPLGYPLSSDTHNWTLLTEDDDSSLSIEPAIEWASTETSQLYSGYMEGALLVGNQIAKRILSKL